MNPDAIYDILVAECGATEADRENFRFHFPVREWRFQGALGFGGKVYYDTYDGRFSVACYPEDETPERRAMIDRANALLDDLPMAGERA